MRLNTNQIKQFNKEEFFERLYLNPEKALKAYFTDLNEFKEACLDCTIKDLKELLFLLKQHELYKHCSIIQELLDNLL